MREKEPQFIVTDRRKFTAEGELREGQPAESAPPPAPTPEPVAVAVASVPEPEAELEAEELPEAYEDEIIPEPTSAETAQQKQEYLASSSRLNEMILKANPGQPLPPAINFDRLVQSLYMTAAMQMGAGTAANEQPRIDIVGRPAKHRHVARARGKDQRQSGWPGTAFVAKCAF